MPTHSMMMMTETTLYSCVAAQSRVLSAYLLYLP